MTHETMYLNRSRDVRNVLIGYKCFPRIFLVENWFSIIFKNNTYSEKNSVNKYMLKVNKRHTNSRCELLPKLASKNNISN